MGEVNNAGTLTDLNFKDNGVNLATLAPPAPLPGQPGAPPRPEWPFRRRP